MATRTALPCLFVLATAVFAGGRLHVTAGHDRNPDAAGSVHVTGGQRMVARVTRVIDGDTVQASVLGTTQTVRYIGVDTPESVKPGTPVACYAEAASHHNAQLVDREEVVLIAGEEPRDRYGRLLAYVFRSSDERFVNAELVARGFARTLAIAPNIRFAPRFAALAQAARQARRGLWGAC